MIVVTCCCVTIVPQTQRRRTMCIYGPRVSEGAESGHGSVGSPHAAIGGAGLGAQQSLCGEGTCIQARGCRASVSRQVSAPRPPGLASHGSCVLAGHVRTRQLAPSLSHSHIAPGAFATKKCSHELDMLPGPGHGAPGVSLDTVPGASVDVFLDQVVFRWVARAQQQRALPSVGGLHSPSEA